MPRHLVPPAAALAVAACLLAPCPAQSSTANEVVLNPQAVRFVSRGDLAKGRGEILQGFHRESWRGLGDLGKSCRATSFVARNFHDQDRKTAESFRWVVRKGSDAKGPTAGAAGLIFRSGALPLGPSTGTGPIAYRVTTILKTPVALPCDQFFAVGAELGPAASWPSDGLACWIGADLGNVDDNKAHPKARDHAWQIVGSASKATHPSGRRTWSLGFGMESPALQIGNVNNEPPKTRFGSGGLFPLPGQGLTARVRARGLDGQIAFVILSSRISPVGVRLFPKGARLWANLIGFVGPIGLARPIRNGVAEIPLTRIPHGFAVDLTWQAFVLDARALQVQFSNAVRTSVLR